MTTPKYIVGRVIAVFMDDGSGGILVGTNRDPREDVNVFVAAAQHVVSNLTCPEEARAIAVHFLHALGISDIAETDITESPLRPRDEEGDR